MREGSAAPDMGEFAGGSERRELELLGGHGRSLVTAWRSWKVTGHVGKCFQRRVCVPWTCFHGTGPSKLRVSLGTGPCLASTWRGQSLAPTPHRDQSEPQEMVGCSIRARGQNSCRGGAQGVGPRPHTLTELLRPAHVPHGGDSSRRLL